MSPQGSADLCFMYLESTLLDAYKFSTVFSSWCTEQYQYTRFPLCQPMLLPLSLWRGDRSVVRPYYTSTFVGLFVYFRQLFFEVELTYNKLTYWKYKIAQVSIRVYTCETTATLKRGNTSITRKFPRALCDLSLHPSQSLGNHWPTFVLHTSLHFPCFCTDRTIWHVLLSGYLHAALLPWDLAVSLRGHCL